MLSTIAAIALKPILAVIYVSIVYFIRDFIMYFVTNQKLRNLLLTEVLPNANSWSSNRRAFCAIG